MQDIIKEYLEQVKVGRKQSFENQLFNPPGQYLNEVKGAEGRFALLTFRLLHHLNQRRQYGRDSFVVDRDDDLHDMGNVL